MKVIEYDEAVRAMRAVEERDCERYGIDSPCAFDSGIAVKALEGCKAYRCVSCSASAWDGGVLVRKNDAVAAAMPPFASSRPDEEIRGRLLALGDCHPVVRGLSVSDVVGFIKGLQCEDELSELSWELREQGYELVPCENRKGKAVGEYEGKA